MVLLSYYSTVNIACPILFFSILTSKIELCPTTFSINIWEISLFFSEALIAFFKMWCFAPCGTVPFCAGEASTPYLCLMSHYLIRHGSIRFTCHLASISKASGQPRLSSSKVVWPFLLPSLEIRGEKALSVGHFHQTFITANIPSKLQITPRGLLFIHRLRNDTYNLRMSLQ